MSNVLSDRELRRYARQTVLSEVGTAGQARLKQASVLVVGAGGLGSPVSMYLAAAGVGRLGLVDFDTVDASNLHRQILHTEPFIGRHKLDSARQTLTTLNPHTELVTHPVRLTRENALDLIESYDIVADGTDNFATRYLVNDACVLTATPNVYGSVYQFEGQVTVFAHEAGPCYRCLFPKPPPPHLVPSCAEGGVLGVLPGIIGLMQATEVIKLILAAGKSLIGRLLLFNALDATWQQVNLRRDPNCVICGPTPSIVELIDYEEFCQVTPEISVETLGAWRRGRREFHLLDVRDHHESAKANMNADQVIPVDSLSSVLDTLPVARDSLVVVHCQTGVRSQKAVRILREAGFSQAVSLAGGLEAWQRAEDQSSP